MLIAVHRRGVVVAKKRYVCSPKIRSLRPDKYIRISAFPFNPFYAHLSKIQNLLLNKFFMSKKYIQDSLMLTKEAFIEAALRQQQTEATQYGLTLEQWQQAIASGSVVQAKPLPDL